MSDYGTRRQFLTALAVVPVAAQVKKPDKPQAPRYGRYVPNPDGGPSLIVWSEKFEL